MACRTGTTYDAIGNPDTHNGYTLVWDGRQLSRMYNSLTNVSFTYNADGIRTSKSPWGLKHTYTLNGTQILSEEYGQYFMLYLYDESGAPMGMQVRKTTYAEGVFDAYYFEKNLQGDIVAVYDATGKKLGGYTYDAWGACTVTYAAGTTSAEGKSIGGMFGIFSLRKDLWKD